MTRVVSLSYLIARNYSVHRTIYQPSPVPAMSHIKCPSRNSWLRTLLLIFSRVIVILLLVKFLKALPKSSLQALVSPDNFSLRILASIGVWVSFSTLMGVWNHLICVFKGETKPWKVQTKSVAEAVGALKVSFWSDGIAVVFGLFFLFALNSALKLNEKDSKVLLGLTILLVPVIWFFSIPLLYETVLGKRKSKVKSKTKHNKKPAPTSSPPVRTIKTPKQATPEVADWYVFRSGKAEGPYTALQLWEIQKITARTKVRRGESSWQRAGEIVELAKFLTDK